MDQKNEIKSSKNKVLQANLEIYNMIRFSRKYNFYGVWFEHFLSRRIQREKQKAKNGSEKSEILGSSR